MNEELIYYWNNSITSKDKVYVIGDFSFGNHEQTKSVYDRLQGEKILIRGNHDNNHTCDLFDEVHDSLTLPIGGNEVLLCHYPYKYEDKDVTNGYKVSNGHLRPTEPREASQWLIHGHVHNLWQIMSEKCMINVGVDVWNFQPITESHINDIIDRHSPSK